METGHPPRRVSAGKRPKGHGSGHGVEEDAEVDGEIHVGQPPRTLQDLQEDEGAKETKQSTKDAQNDVLEDELPDELGRCGSEGFADANLRGPFENPAQIHVDEVDRGQRHEEQGASQENGDEAKDARLLTHIDVHHLTGERLEVGAWRGDQGVEVGGIRHLDSLDAREEFLANALAISGILQKKDPAEAADQAAQVRVSRIALERNPEVGVGVFSNDRAVGHDSDDPKPLAVGLEVFANRTFAAKETLGRAAAEHGHGVPAVILFLGKGTSVEELEIEDVPVSAVGATAAQLDLFAADERDDAIGSAMDRQRLDAVDIPEIAVEKQVAGAARGRHPLAEHPGAAYLEGLWELGRGRVRDQDRVQEGHHHQQHHQGEGHTEEADEGEELSPGQDFEREFQVVLKHVHLTKPGVHRRDEWCVVCVPPGLRHGSP